MSTSINRFALAAITAFAGMSAHATVINFDELSNGTLVANQYAAQGVTFSSGSGQAMFVTTQPSFQSTPPNFLCTGPDTGGIDCAGTVIFDFATAVNNLQFDALGNNNGIGSVFALADIYQNGLLTVSNLQLTVSQGDTLPDHQDFSAYSNITKVVLHDHTDGGGTGYDTLSFDVASNKVPEPATTALVGIALAGIALSRRRKAC